jgi:sec-independent protein translocase protein TatA
MFGSIGFPELLIIMTIALLVFGPKKLPEVGKSIGKAMREFRRTSDEIKGRIEEEIQADELKEVKNDFKAATDFKGTFDLEPKSTPKEDPYAKPETEPEGSPEKDSGLNEDGNKDSG